MFTGLTCGSKFKDNQMATAWQLRNHMPKVMTPASAIGHRTVRALQRQAQNNKAKSANKPLVAGRINVVRMGLRASRESIFTQCAFKGDGHLYLGEHNHRMKPYDKHLAI
jgi:hypothetical protein